ncbi:MAG: nucleoside transporter C-terminal domain-containing protein [Planctomycetota bacterium]
MFGPLAKQPQLQAAFGEGLVLGITITVTIILVSSLTAILYHMGVMQRVVYVMARIMHGTMRTSGAESLAAAANVFVGQTEAPLTVRPYLAKMTSSEVMAMMCGGMATIAGGVLAVYVSFGIDAGHLLAASVMSAPAALALAKVMVPETEQSQTAAKVPLEIRKIDSNVLDAACRGASEGMKLSINVLAMLIAFVALLALVNGLLNGSYQWVAGMFMDETADPGTLRLETILGWLMAPLMWLMGIPWGEAQLVGGLVGLKTVATEFLAFLQLRDLRAELSPRTFTIATYALCGFANFASIAIQIGGISALEEGIRPKLAKLGLLALVGGTLAALMTAAVAGMLT